MSEPPDWRPDGEERAAPSPALTREALLRVVETHVLMTNPAECDCEEWSYRNEPAVTWNDHFTDAILAALSAPAQRGTPPPAPTSTPNFGEQLAVKGGPVSKEIERRILEQGG